MKKQTVRWVVGVCTFAFIFSIVVAAQHAGLGEHAHERLLDEVLGVLARAAQRPCRPVQAVHVLRQRLWIEIAHGCRKRPPPYAIALVLRL